MRVQGHFRILSFFDIGEAIELERLSTLLDPGAARYAPGFVHHTPEYAQAQNVPIREAVGSITLASGEKLEAAIKYYWFGVASVEQPASA